MSVSPVPSHQQQNHSSSKARLRPHVTARELLEHFQAKMSHDQKQHQQAPEQINLRNYCENANDLTPRSRRAVLNLGIDFSDEIVAVPNLHNLPSAARGLAEAEARWLHHLGRRRFEVVEALAEERERLIEQQSQAREQRDSFLKQQSEQRDQNHASNERRRLSPRGGGGGGFEVVEGGGEGEGGSQPSSSRNASARTPRSMTPAGRSTAGSRTRRQFSAASAASGAAGTSAVLDPAEYQQFRAQKQEEAMMEAMKKKIEADERLRQNEERNIALAQLTVKRQQQQERAAQKARERAEAAAEQKRRERAEHEMQKAQHRREVQMMRDELEDAMRKQQEEQELEKEMTVEERRHSRMQRLRAQRKELEKKRIEQHNRLIHLQHSIEDAEQRRREEVEEKLKKADIARERHKRKQEEVLAMHSDYQEQRTQIYRERKEAIDDAHVGSINRYKEKGQTAMQKRDEILAARQKALKARVLQHAQRELAARQIRTELDREEEDNARELEMRLYEQENRSKTVLQKKADAAKMRLAEKQLVFHDHKMHAVHIHRMQEVREAALQKKMEQKMGRIEQLKEDAEELDQYRKGLRHILEATKSGAHMAGGGLEGRARSPALVPHQRPAATSSSSGNRFRRNASTPAPTTTFTYQQQSHSVAQNPGPGAYDVQSSEAKLAARGQTPLSFGTASQQQQQQQQQPANQATRMDPGPGQYALPSGLKQKGVLIPPPKNAEAH